jgi:predicted PurR-regulated permease PerM
MKEIFFRANQYLLFAILLTIVLYFGRTLIIPLVFAAMLAMLMAPVCRRLDRLGLKRGLSTFFCVFILVLVIVGIGAIIGAQFASFAKDIDKIEKKGKEVITQGQTYIQEKFGVSPEKQESVVKEKAKEAGNKAGGMATRFISGFTSSLAGMVITLVFTFLFIFSKEKYENFFLKLFRNQDQQEVKKVVEKISTVAQKYLTGRAMSIGIIAVLYAIGLSIVGLKNAVLLAGIAALLTLIPYVGTVLGGLFPVFMALVTEDNTQTAIWCVVVLFVIQTLDNYFIEPNVVGGEVNLSALTSIVCILAGGMIWGVAGMILFLPLTGIVKIICDHVESLQPIGYVIGDPDANKKSKLTQWFKKKFHLGK